MSDAVNLPAFEVVGDGEPSDATVELLAALLLDTVEQDDEGFEEK